MFKIKFNFINLIFLIIIKKVDIENEKLTKTKTLLEGVYKDLHKKSCDHYEEHKQLIQDGQNKRKELGESFQTQINEISEKLKNIQIEKMKKFKENEMFILLF